MGIKLRADIDPDFREPRGTLRELQHDAAVAHALLKAIETLPEKWLQDEILGRCEINLRTDFGIEE